MVLIENKLIEGIPVLHIVKKHLYDQKLPFIMFIHGFGSAKEHNLHFAYLLAEKGFRVVLPEAIHHGERESGLKKHELAMNFWHIVMQTISELETLKNVYENENLIDANRIGLVGTSMGGIVTLGALTKYKWISTAVSLMGMPYYEKFALWQIDEIQKQGLKLPLKQSEIDELLYKLKDLDLGSQPEKLNQRPLLFWHGKQDNIVPFHYTYHFYESIQSLYSETPDKLQFITDEKAGHKVSREGLLKTVHWFETYLT
jgi:uncharacterized protein